MEIPRRSAGFPFIYPASRKATQGTDLVDKPNSVSPAEAFGEGGSMAIIYLGSRLLGTSSGTSRRWRDTALHTGKDLFVAFSSRDERIPQGNSFAFAQDVSVVTSILADDGRYPLPFYQ